MRLGIFGGTFDPVHYGHLLLAECCREQAKLDQVWFVPAARSPHKQDRRTAPGAARAEMLELAIGGDERMRVWRGELERGGLSYTVDTLSLLGQQQPEDELFLLLGADALFDFPRWREPDRIAQLATLTIVARAAAPPPDLTPLAPLTTPDRLASIRSHLVSMPQVELSSSDLRRRIAAGQSIRFRTPRAVEKYIETHGLYAQG